MSQYHGKLWKQFGRVSNPRGFHKPVQEQEDAAVLDLEAPFPADDALPRMIRWPSGPSALSDIVRERPQRKRLDADMGPQ